jgi:hypothetical protein
MIINKHTCLLSVKILTDNVACLYGYWLRYGTSNSQELCVGPDDDQIIEVIQDLAGVLRMNTEGPFISDAIIESRPLRTVMTSSAQKRLYHPRRITLESLQWSPD